MIFRETGKSKNVIQLSGCPVKKLKMNLNNKKAKKQDKKITRTLSFTEGFDDR